VSFITRIDLGWFYLICGLTLTVAAIIIPAKEDLLQLELKRDAIVCDLDGLRSQIEVYKQFLDDLKDSDSEIHDKVAEMQFNLTSNGAPIVIDMSASQTPLAWLSKRARKAKVLEVEHNHASLLTSIVQGRGRLWLIACGAFLMFVGLVGNKQNI
jgi:hypothetical protein